MSDHMNTDRQTVAVTRLIDRKPLEGTDLFCQYHVAVNMPGVAALWVGRHTPTADDPHHYETLEQAWLFKDEEFDSAAEVIEAWNADRVQRLTRDRVGEALRRLTHGLIRPLWADMPEERRESWRGAADFLIRLLRSFGLRIELEDGTHGRAG